MIAWIMTKLAGFAFGRFIKQAGPVVLPALVLAIAAGFIMFQNRQINDLTLKNASLQASLSTCKQNVADVLRDKVRDDEIDNLTDDDLFQRAIDRGWLLGTEGNTTPDGSSLLPD